MAGDDENAGLEGAASPEVERDAADRRATDPSARVQPKTELAPAQAPRASTTEPKDDRVGKIFGGKYRIDRLVAKGGMGRVYRGTQFPLERPVAIKILNREFQRIDPQFTRRFFLEASTAARLSHPHTITVFDYGEAENGDLYIAMEYLRGRSLSRMISSEGPIAAERALHISLQVCRALREAHALGVIHRDLKPGNIFIVEDGDDADYAKVLDFGLVKLFRPEAEGDPPAGILGEGDLELTRTGTLLGSPKYMSPEQIQGRRLDPRTDIYSFGVILFQMIAGKPPFTGSSGVDVIYKHVHHAAPSIAAVAPEVECPAPVEIIIQRCLSKSRDDRYPSMDELIVHIKDALRSVTGVSVLGDSVAEVVPPAGSGGLSAPKVRTLRPESQADHRDASTREAGFRDPLLVDDPTPIGQLNPDRALEISGPAPRSSRIPLVVSAVGFAIALATLVYVMRNSGEIDPAGSRRAGALPSGSDRVPRVEPRVEAAMPGATPTSTPAAIIQRSPEPPAPPPERTPDPSTETKERKPVLQSAKKRRPPSAKPAKKEKDPSARYRQNPY